MKMCVVTCVRSHVCGHMCMAQGRRKRNENVCGHMCVVTCV